MVPRFADQFENARRITDARAGRTVELRRTGDKKPAPLDENTSRAGSGSLWRKCCQTFIPATRRSPRPRDEACHAEEVLARLSAQPTSLSQSTEDAVTTHLYGRCGTA